MNCIKYLVFIFNFLFAVSILFVVWCHKIYNRLSVRFVSSVWFQLLTLEGCFFHPIVVSVLTSSVARSALNN